MEGEGLLKQIDAGGAQFISGANMNDDIFCLPEQATVSAKDGSALPWNNIAGKLKYYSCNTNSCWGVNSADDIFYRFSVTPSSCSGSRWQQVEGKLAMIEVGSDGSVFGVNSVGDAYQRYYMKHLLWSLIVMIVRLEKLSLRVFILLNLCL
ncbi:hypothetical protein NDU88_005984 [Pleurodeles waltl]|uniref:Uncharacterized protein n=1 Tax=Pleurodeles waltl TaxID=8319 RepID=A0AAV7QGF1_PLEWA|nr:hypothetical protein NDU88_005984 [Pleurodeles waltl]